MATAPQTLDVPKLEPERLSELELEDVKMAMADGVEVLPKLGTDRSASSWSTTPENTLRSTLRASTRSGDKELLTEIELELRNEQLRSEIKAKQMEMKEKYSGVLLGDFMSFYIERPPVGVTLWMDAAGNNAIVLAVMNQSLRDNGVDAGDYVFMVNSHVVLHMPHESILNAIRYLSASKCSVLSFVFYKPVAGHFVEPRVRICSQVPTRLVYRDVVDAKSRRHDEKMAAKSTKLAGADEDIGSSAPGGLNAAQREDSVSFSASDDLDSSFLETRAINPTPPPAPYFVYGTKYEHIADGISSMDALTPTHSDSEISGFGLGTDTAKRHQRRHSKNLQQLTSLPSVLSLRDARAPTSKPRILPYAAPQKVNGGDDGGAHSKRREAANVLRAHRMAVHSREYGDQMFTHSHWLLQKHLDVLMSSKAFLYRAFVLKESLFRFVNACRLNHEAIVDAHIAEKKASRKAAARKRAIAKAMKKKTAKKALSLVLESDESELDDDVLVSALRSDCSSSMASSIGSTEHKEEYAFEESRSFSETTEPSLKQLEAGATLRSTMSETSESTKEPMVASPKRRKERTASLALRKRNETCAAFDRDWQNVDVQLTATSVRPALTRRLARVILSDPASDEDFESEHSDDELLGAGDLTPLSHATATDLDLDTSTPLPSAFGQFSESSGQLPQPSSKPRLSFSLPTMNRSMPLSVDMEMQMQARRKSVSSKKPRMLRRSILESIALPSGTDLFEASELLKPLTADWGIVSHSKHLQIVSDMVADVREKAPQISVLPLSVPLTEIYNDKHWEALTSVMELPPAHAILRTLHLSLSEWLVAYVRMHGAHSTKVLHLIADYSPPRHALHTIRNALMAEVSDKRMQMVILRTICLDLARMLLKVLHFLECLLKKEQIAVLDLLKVAKPWMAAYNWQLEMHCFDIDHCRLACFNQYVDTCAELVVCQSEALQILKCAEKEQVLAQSRAQILGLLQKDTAQKKASVST